MEPAKTIMHVSHNDQFTLLFAYSSCLCNKSYTVEPVQGTYIMISYCALFYSSCLGNKSSSLELAQMNMTP